MRGSYKLSPEAESDLYRIWLYGCQRWGADAADRYYAAFFERFEAIAANPQHYSSVDEIQKGYRRSVFGRDSVYYRVVGDEVEVMAIIGQQDLEAWL